MKLVYTKGDIQYLYNRLKNIAWISFNNKNIENVCDIFIYLQ